MVATTNNMQAGPAKGLHGRTLPNDASYGKPLCKLHAYKAVPVLTENKGTRDGWVNF